MGDPDTGEVGTGVADIEDTQLNFAVTGYHEHDGYDSAYDVEYDQVDTVDGNRWTTSIWFDDDKGDAINKQCEARGGSTYNPSLTSEWYVARFEFPSGSKFTAEKMEPDEDDINNENQVNQSVDVALRSSIGYGPFAFTVTPNGGSDYVDLDDYQQLEWSLYTHYENWPDTQEDGDGAAFDVVTNLGGGESDWIWPEAQYTCSYYCDGRTTYTKSGWAEFSKYVDVVDASDT